MQCDPQTESRTSAPVLATPQMQMPGSAPNASLPFWSEDDIRRNAPRLPSEGPPGLPPYLQQEGLLDLDSALWLWLGYRSEQWQRADVRISHLVGRTGSWYWTLEIILPIPGLPGLEVRGLAHAVARVPAANACRQAGPNDPPPMSGMPPSHAPARRAAEAPHTEEPEAKRRMGEVQGMACRKDPSRMSVSLPVAPVPPPCAYSTCVEVATRADIPMATLRSCERPRSQAPAHCVAWHEDRIVLPRKTGTPKNLRHSPHSSHT